MTNSSIKLRAIVDYIYKLDEKIVSYDDALKKLRNNTIDWDKNIHKDERPAVQLLLEEKEKAKQLRNEILDSDVTGVNGLKI